SALLAIAYREFGIPLLSLFDVRSGLELRRLTGHTDRVRGLAFSADGKQLASASEDQTVSVWNLSDLGSVQGKLGLLRGLVVREQEEGPLQIVQKRDIYLSEGNRKALEDAGIEEKDPIDGLVIDGKLRPLRRAADFYRTVWQQRPGSTIAARIK